MTAVVTAGYTFSGGEKLTYAKLNQLGQPTVALLGEGGPLTTLLVTILTGTSYSELSANAADHQLEGLVRLNFDGTDADKVVYLPEPATGLQGRAFRLAVTKAATAGSRKITVKVGTHTTPVNGKLVARAANGDLPTAVGDAVDVTGAATGAQAALCECVCDGTYWYVRV